jgi:hypothetical protein
MELPLSLFDRTISRPHPRAFLITLAVILLSLPFIFAALDGIQLEVIHSGLWRNLLVQPVVIIYVLTIAPLLSHMGEDVLTSFRQLVDLDEQSYYQLLAQVSTIPVWHEIVAILVGILFGIQSIYWGMSGNGLNWLSVYWVVSTCVMFGLLTWTVYVSFASTRLTSAIHQHVRQIDLFDTSPFQAIGRQSLALALAFMGGLLLSLIFGTQAESYLAVEFWVTYGIMGIVPLAVFFLNMLPTHRLLTQEKKRRTDELAARMRRLVHQLDALPLDGELPSQLSMQFSALAAYEQRLANTRTWPYNTTQLRTVFFSILIPAITMLVRLFVEEQLK